MKTVAIMNPKGGTGKTLTAYALSTILTQKGFKVLVVDADWQGALSEMSGVNAESANATLNDFLSGKECDPTSLVIAKNGYALIPCGLTLRTSFEGYKETALKTILNQFDASFDYCIIDAPPYLDAWGKTILMAAQSVIVPDHMDSPVGIMNSLQELIQSVQESGNPDLRVEGILFTEAEDVVYRRSRLQQAAEKLNTKVFRSEIQYEPALQTTSIFKADAFEECVWPYMVADYEAFAEEFLDVMADS